MPRSMGHGKKSYSNGFKSFTAQEKFSGGGGWWQTKFSVKFRSRSLVLGPFGPDLDLAPGPELDNIQKFFDK